MAHQLIINLGRVPKNEDGYRTAPYRFPDGRSYTTSFFGLALLTWLRETGSAPDRLLILGTSASMWEAWLESERVDPHLPDGHSLGDHSDFFIDLAGRTERHEARDQELTALAVILERSLGISVRCRVIPAGADPQEHLAILQVLDEETERGAKLSLDFTHAFRHLPLLQLLALQHLHLAKNCRIAGVWYGMFEPDKGEAAAVRLGLVNDFFEWTEAVSRARVGLRLGEFAGLPGIKDRAQTGSNLLETEHCLRSSVFTKAREAARRTLEDLATPLPGLAALFKEELQKQATWITNGSLAEAQIEAARRFLRDRDFLRASILAYEALVTHHIEQGCSPLDYKHREDVGKRLRQDPPWPLDDVSLQTLIFVRNGVVHGSRVEAGGPAGRAADQITRGTDPFEVRKHLGHLVELVHRCIKGS